MAEQATATWMERMMARELVMLAREMAIAAVKQALAATATALAAASRMVGGIWAWVAAASRMVVGIWAWVLVGREAHDGTASIPLEVGLAAAPSLEEGTQLVKEAGRKAELESSVVAPEALMVRAVVVAPEALMVRAVLASALAASVAASVAVLAAVSAAALAGGLVAAEVERTAPAEAKAMALALLEADAEARAAAQRTAVKDAPGRVGGGRGVERQTEASLAVVGLQATVGAATLAAAVARWRAVWLHMVQVVCWAAVRAAQQAEGRLEVVWMGPLVVVGVAMELERLAGAVRPWAVTEAAGWPATWTVEAASAWEVVVSLALLLA